MAGECQETTVTRRDENAKVAPQPGLTPAEPEHPEDIVVEGIHEDERERDKGNPFSRFFGRLFG